MYFLYSYLWTLFIGLILFYYMHALNCGLYVSVCQRVRIEDNFVKI